MGERIWEGGIQACTKENGVKDCSAIENGPDSKVYDNKVAVGQLGVPGECIWMGYRKVRPHVQAPTKQKGGAKGKGLRVSRGINETLTFGGKKGLQG